MALANPAGAVAAASARSNAGGNGHGLAVGNPHLQDGGTDLVTNAPDPAADTKTADAATTAAVAPAVSNSSGTSGSLLQPQPRSNADNNGRGANVTGDFDSTRDGSPSHNGNATTQPAAAAKGKADNKNPPGQLLNDHNRGYECDGNHGIGKTNPAHTGCPRPPPPPCRDTPGHPCNPCRDTPGHSCNPCRDTPGHPCTPPSGCTSNCTPPSVCTSNCTPPQSACVAGEAGCTSITPPGRVGVLGLTLTRGSVVLGATETAVGAGTLPRTGVDTAPLVFAAFLMIVSGLALVRRAERVPAPAEVVVRLR